MKFILWLTLIHMVGCSTAPIAPKDEVVEDTVSVETTLEHIRQSYILGCVEALKSVGKQNTLPGCRDKGTQHSESVRKMLNEPLETK